MFWSVSTAFTFWTRVAFCSCAYMLGLACRMLSSRADTLDVMPPSMPAHSRVCVSSPVWDEGKICWRGKHALL